MPKSPVTHDQFDAAMTAIKTDFDRVDEHFKEVDQRFDRLEEKMDKKFEQVDRRFEQVLTILTSIDANMKELRTLPARVERLERAVFK